MILREMTDACCVADDTPVPAEFFCALAKRWSLVRRDPSKLVSCIESLQDSPLYASWIKQGTSLSEAGESGALPISSGVPSSAASATSTPSLGKRKGAPSFKTGKAGTAGKAGKAARKKKAASRGGGSSDEDE